MEFYKKYIIFLFSVTIFLWFILHSSIPDVDFRNGVPVSVEDGECRKINSSYICFSTLQIFSFDSGFTPVAKVSGSDFEDENLILYIFNRESNLSSGSWPENSSVFGGSGNVSVPDYNVSVPLDSSSEMA